MFKILRCWYYRNFKYSKDDIIEITFDRGWRPKLLDIVIAGRGDNMLYIGKNKFVQIENNSKFFNKNVKTQHIPHYDV